MKLIYLLPLFYKSKGEKTLGLSKDIINVENYFSYKKMKYKKYFTSSDLFNNDDKKIYQDILITRPNFIFLEKYLSLKFIFFLFFIKKFKLRKTKIIYRSHNAEIFHRLDFIKACFKQIKLKKSNVLKFSLLLNSIKNLFLISFKEFLMVLFTDIILSTNKWEKKNYWKKIYNYEAISLHPFVEKKNTVKGKKIINEICLVPCAKPTNIIANDQLVSFLKNIHDLNNLHIKYLFTGDIPEYLKKNILFFARKNKLNKKSFYFLENKKKIVIKNFYHKIIKPKELGFDKNISFEKICSLTNKSLILSELGYGVKTKILEFIFYNHTVFLSKKIFKQQDNLIRKNTLMINDILQFKKKINKKIKIDRNINILLKKNYYNQLNKIF